MLDMPGLPTLPGKTARARGGPYSSAELMMVSVEPAPVERDPEVAAAEQVRDEARATFDLLDDLWRRATAARRAADFTENGNPDTRRQLVEDEEAARERRDRAVPLTLLLEQRCCAPTDLASR
jgi:hypothetical protein